MKDMNKIKVVPLEFLLELQENEEDFKLVEALTEKAYNMGHLPGAMFMPINRVEELAPLHLSKDDKIVVYCTGYTCHASTRVSRKLLEIGYENVFEFKAGKAGWKKAGFKMVGEIK